MTMDNLCKIDPELADAYDTFLSRTIETDEKHSILNGSEHNEILVSNPIISGIFTADINALPLEYLQKAQEENLPIVLFK